MRTVSVGAAALAAVLLPGCAARTPAIVEAGGVVTLDGVPLPKAKVCFYPRFENASEYIAQGVTDADGRFTLTCYGQSGACAAESIVTVADEDIPERLTPESARQELSAYLKTLKNRPIPPLYKTPAESPLRMTVSANLKEYRIELKR
ncbi:hypothetical protein J0H58_11460 [bacterium]|nr:hypothetical protein [bacterium]